MLVHPLFHDRIEAGQVLARKLRSLVFDPKLLVLALPRGGVPVAFQIAQALQADLDIFVVRKIGVPGQEELAMALRELLDSREASAESLCEDNRCAGFACANAARQVQGF